MVKIGVGNNLALVGGGELVRDALGLAGGDDVQRHRWIVAATELAIPVVLLNREGEKIVAVASSGGTDATQDKDAAEAIANVPASRAGGKLAHGGGGPHLDKSLATVAAVLGVAFHLRADDALVAAGGATVTSVTAITAAFAGLYTFLVSRLWARCKLLLSDGILLPLVAVLVLPLVVAPAKLSAVAIGWAAIFSQCLRRLRRNRPEGGQDCQCQ